MFGDEINKSMSYSHNIYYTIYNCFHRKNKDSMLLSYVVLSYYMMFSIIVRVHFLSVFFFFFIEAL